MRIARSLVLVLGLVACRPARHAPRQPPTPWTPPEGCAVNPHRSETRLADRATATLIKDADALREMVSCADAKRDAFDFEDEWLATFTFVSQGGAYKPLGLRDDGTTLTLDVESYSYCGGTPPPTSVDTIVFRVPAERRKLATNVVPANRPACSPNIP